jgi:hypothetical protein
MTIAFDDIAVAKFFDQQIDAGRRPEQFGRIWIHTHPGHCATPSSVDEETFARVFGRSEWAVMAILAQGGQSYARMTFHVGPQASLEIPVEVSFHDPFAGSDWPAWEQEFRDNVISEYPAIACDGFEEISGHHPDEHYSQFNSLLQNRNPREIHDRSIYAATRSRSDRSPPVAEDHGRRSWGDW